MVYPNYKDLGLDDTRTLDYGQRFFVTNNILHPKVYQVTKVVELVPKGMIKFSIKQDEFYEERDNLSLMICDFYGETGHSLVEAEKLSTDSTRCEIRSMHLTDKEELEYDEINITAIKMSKTSYLKAVFDKDSRFNPVWKIELIDDELSDDDKSYYSKLLQFTDFNDGVISVQPKKVKSLIGKRFLLSVVNDSGISYSSIELEVTN